MNLTQENSQALVNGMSKQWEKERSDSQLTLGELIEVLSSMPQDSMIEGIGGAHSYRGYYSDLSFNPLNEKIKVSTLLKECKEAMGQVFQGWKGGDFPMHSNSPLWVACEGDTGKKIISLSSDGIFELKEDSY